MSIYLQIDSHVGPSQIASNKGYSCFGKWVDSLDVKKYTQLIHLYEHGWCQQVKSLRLQLSRALKDHSPKDAGVREVAEALAELLAGEDDATVATITDGIG